MRRYLEAHAEEIESALSGSLHFDYGDDVTAKVTRVDRLRDLVVSAVQPVMD